VSIPEVDLATRLPGIQSPEQVTNAQELRSMNELLVVFSVAPTRGHLHIIVQPPPSVGPYAFLCSFCRLFTIRIPIKLRASRNGSFPLGSLPFAMLEPPFLILSPSSTGFPPPPCLSALSPRRLDVLKLVSPLPLPLTTFS
jgi:hypothetical protein